MILKRHILMLAALLTSVASFSFPGGEQIVTWKHSVEHKEGDVYQVKFTGNIQPGYHTYALDDKEAATSFDDLSVEGGQLSGSPYALNEPTVESDGSRHYYSSIVLAQDIVLTSDKAVFSGTIQTSSCKGNSCHTEYYDFTAKVAASAGAAEAVSAAQDTVSPAGPASETDSTDGSLWALIIEAILWGFAMLLTPCVFPMVPMTVSFFMKGSASPAQGRFKASMYGLFIILLYTVPISVVILLTRIIGGDAVTADIFNWLATHWLPNLIFFVVFMIFAASFFGAFEITLPQSLINKSDKGADKGGLAGVFFMALTLVLVSFSCTGPIVGSVLIKSTRGEFWEPMITMLAFSAAFALPFTVLAFSPSLLTRFKKSGGGWLNSVKVVLGFVEVALGLKFLSVADQTYHWGILDREVYLAIWIVVFTLLGFYLLGKIRFAHDEKVEHISVPRLALVIAVFSFVVYLIPGMFGAPLKMLSGYMPPVSTQDFVLGSNVESAQKTVSSGQKYDLHLPLGLEGYFTLEEGIEAAKAEGKPVFVDVTGHGCVNCREMEARVWSAPAVLEMLKNDFVIVALYNDDKTKLDKEDYITDAVTGKVYKDLGRKNSYIARTRFNVNAQPNYIILSSEGEQLLPARGYNLDIDGFVEFLKEGLAANAR